VKRSVLLAALVAGLLPAAAHAFSPRVVGGTKVPITSAPWSVFIVTKDGYDCTGSILDARHVLAAGHCAFPEGGGALRPVANYAILAGFSDVSTWDPSTAPPAGTQVVDVSAVRVHPNFVASPLTDDVVMFTLASSLNLSGANAKAIALAGAPVPPGTVAQAAGYGKETGAGDPNGGLYAAPLSVISDDACRSLLSPNESAGDFCANSSTASVCNGDSGSALTVGGVEIGITDFGVDNCPLGSPQGFVDVTAPEIRTFINAAVKDTTAAIPLAPRLAGQTLLNWTIPPVVGSPLVCTPGTWSGGAAITYAFESDATAQVLQSGPSNSYAPTSADIGKPIVCVITAANAGGASWSRSGTSPGIVADTVKPVSRIDQVRCKRRTCRVRFEAADPNSRGRVTTRVTAKYAVRVRCRRHGHTTHCTRHRTRTLKVKATSATTYEATGTHMPRKRLEFLLRVTDAAGNRARTRTAHATSR
jgi:hypothetical protein